MNDSKIVFKMLLRMSDQGEEDEWGMRHVGKIREIRTWFWWETPKQEDRLEDLGVEGDKMRADLKEIGWDGLYRIYLAEYRNKWWILINAIKNVWVPQNVGIFSSYSSKTTLHEVS